MAIGAQKTQLSDHSDFLKLVAHFLEEQLKQCLYSRIVINVFYATVKSWFNSLGGGGDHLQTSVPNHPILGTLHNLEPLIPCYLSDLGTSHTQGPPYLGTSHNWEPLIPREPSYQRTPHSWGHFIPGDLANIG